MRENLVLQLSFKFALEIINFSEVLELQKKYILARQIFRSGTSIGANVREAQSAESKSDFRHKMKVAHKEAEETKYWLQLCDSAESYPNPGLLLDKIEQLLKISGKIIVSSQ